MKRLILASLICAFALAAYLGREHLLPAVAHWLNVSESPRQCDYVVALPGGPLTRPFVAAALLRTGLAREALVIQTIRYPENTDGLTPPDDELTRRVLMRRGIDPSRIHVLPSRSDSTFSDAEAVSRFLAAHDGATVNVVTSHFHTRRARWIFRQVLGSASDRLHWVAAPDDYFDEDHWWQTREGLAACLSEYPKLVFYHVRYAPGWTLLVCGVPALVITWAVRRRLVRARAQVR
jgi:uncharacterized SAM-binding protein YcdF (DUF218 family)